MKSSTALRRFFATLRMTNLLCLLSIAACSGGADGVGTSTGNPSFPQDLAVASPLETTESPTGVLTLNAIALAQTTAFQSHYAQAVAQIEAVVSGTDTSDCSFDPQLFLTLDQDASCYGPTVAYEGHPDFDPANPQDDNEFAHQENGQLPSGDVGIWLETDAPTGHACAAAELNARMASVRDRSQAALLSLASLICVLNTNNLTLEDNSGEDLLAEMNALEIPNVSFATAMITHSDTTGSDRYSYELDLTLNSGGGKEIHAELLHIPGADENSFRGNLIYRINDEFDPPGNCPAAEQTYNASLSYERVSANAMELETRAGFFCNHDSDGAVNGVVAPGEKFDPGTNPDGWANNFDIFTAGFNPLTLAGDYAYSWQAGSGDGYTRVLNVSVTAEEETELGAREAEAYYGFGDDISETDGAITGFFCNWAGPNAQQNFTPKAQRQTMTFNQTTGRFDATESLITYAPTNSCDYDGTGTFRYDSDANGSINTDPSEPIANELIGLDTIIFDLPQAPDSL